MGQDGRRQLYQCPVWGPGACGLSWLWLVPKEGLAARGGKQLTKQCVL